MRPHKCFEDKESWKLPLCASINEWTVSYWSFHFAEFYFMLLLFLHAIYYGVICVLNYKEHLWLTLKTKKKKTMFLKNKFFVSYSVIICFVVAYKRKIAREMSRNALLRSWVMLRLVGYFWYVTCSSVIITSYLYWLQPDIYWSGFNGKKKVKNQKESKKRDLYFNKDSFSYF